MLLLGVASAVLVVTGAAKLAAVAPVRERAAHLGYPPAAFRAVGALELVGVSALWWGRSGPHALAVAAVVALLALMAGAVVSHLCVGDGPAATAPALVVAGLLVAALWVGVAA